VRVHHAEELAAHIDAGTPGSIARSIASLIRSDELHPGDRLPTVRSLAMALDVGRSAVADAWGVLAENGFIETARRNGTVVRERHVTGHGRYWSVPATPGALQIDLSTGTPDVALLPPLGPALERISSDIKISSYVDPPVLPELEAELRARWPSPPEALTIVDGALDALDRLVSAIVGFGDVVLVEDPTFPPLLDMLELAGADIVGVAVDERGPIIDDLVRGLDRSPVACFFQPFAQNPTGASFDADRVEAIAKAIGDTERPPWIVEDDHTAGLLDGAAPSLSTHLPDRTLTIISFSKTHGPDLRVAAIGGPTGVIASVAERRRLGPIWTSRLVQELLRGMLTDEATNQLVDQARCEYRRRRDDLASALEAEGLRPAAGDGLNLWLPVPDEQRTTWALGVDQIGVAPGRPFAVGDPSGDFLRISLGNARGDLAQVARSISQAASR